MELTDPHVVALAKSADHDFSKALCDRLTLVAGLGVKGDAHAGRTVQHLSWIKAAPKQPNMRQVHLIHAELFDELAEKGFAVAFGALGENITTRGIDLLGLPADARLAIGPTIVRVTGLRNPCRQIETFRLGLLEHMIDKRPDGALQRKTGVMGVVERGGIVTTGMAIDVLLPTGKHRPLEPV